MEYHDERTWNNADKNLLKNTQQSKYSNLYMEDK